jgi:hypothetical protein
MTQPIECEAVTAGQDVVCSRCEFVWSVDDHEPPDCLCRLDANLLIIKRLRTSLDVHDGSET